MENVWRIEYGDERHSGAVASALGRDTTIAHCGIWRKTPNQSSFHSRSTCCPGFVVSIYTWQRWISRRQFQHYRFKWHSQEERTQRRENQNRFGWQEKQHNCR
eukprot:09115_6